MITRLFAKRDLFATLQGKERRKEKKERNALRGRLLGGTSGPPWQPFGGTRRGGRQKEALPEPFFGRGKERKKGGEGLPAPLAVRRKRWSSCRRRVKKVGLFSEDSGSTARSARGEKKETPGGEVLKPRYLISAASGEGKGKEKKKNHGVELDVKKKVFRRSSRAGA